MCIYCSYSAVGANDKTGEMDTKHVIEVLQNIICSNPKYIAITGGEPLIRRDFIEISNYLGNNYKGFKSLMTNATLVNDKSIDCIIKNYSNVDISIDGVDELTCASIRGKGVFDIVIEAIKKLRERGMVNSSLSMVLTGNNIHLKDDFFNLCDNLHVKPMPRQFIGIGRGKKNFDQLNHSEEKKVRVISYDIENIQMLHLNICCCKAGIEEVFIESNGDIYPCPLLMDRQFYIGNLFKDNIILKDFFENKKYLKTSSYNYLCLLDAAEHERYKDCSINQFCITYLAELSAYHNDPEYWNAYCNYHKNSLEQVVWEK